MNKRIPGSDWRRLSLCLGAHEGRSHKKFDQTWKCVKKEVSHVAASKCVLRIVGFTFCILLQTTQLFKDAKPLLTSLVSSRDYELPLQNCLCIGEQMTSSFLKLFWNFLAPTLEINPDVCIRNVSVCLTFSVYIIHPVKISLLSSW